MDRTYTDRTRTSGTCGHQIKSSGISDKQPGMSYQPSFGDGHQQSMAAEIQPFSTGSQQNQQTTGNLDLITQLYVATVSSNFWTVFLTVVFFIISLAI